MNKNGQVVRRGLEDQNWIIERICPDRLCVCLDETIVHKVETTRGEMLISQWL